MKTFLTSLFIIGIILLWSDRQVRRWILMNKYKTILDTLDYFMNKAYGVIYVDQILGYTANGFKNLPKDELETIERNFVKLTLEIMGSINEKNIIDFFGNRKTVINNILLYMRDRLSTDELTDFFKNQDRKSPNKQS